MSLQLPEELNKGLEGKGGWSTPWIAAINLSYSIDDRSLNNFQILGVDVTGRELPPKASWEF